MPAYLVTLNRSKSGHTLIMGGDAMVVFAANADAAKQSAAARFDGDGLAWLNDSTVTEVTAATNWVGWAFRVVIHGGFGSEGADPASVTVVGDATDDTVDEIGAALAVALNALSGIANAAYNASTNTLTIAGTADALGDQTVSVSVVPPGGASSIPALVGTITHEGLAADALSVVLPADAAVIPKVSAVLKQVE